MSKKYILIGIDPGSIRLGYALLIVFNGLVSLEKSGVIVFKKKDTLSQKLLYVFDFFKEIIANYISCGFLVCFSIEKQYLNKNPRSSFVLVSFNSVILLLAESFQTKCFEIAPTQIKKIISGNGACGKLDICFVLERQFGISLDVVSLDESDAIAIAIAGAFLLGA
jgi:crossover junction endodeoxyribonuclease RuvC